MSELEITNNKIFVGIPRERFGMHEFIDSRDKVLATLLDNDALSEGSIYQITSHRVGPYVGRIIVAQALRNTGFPKHVQVIVPRQGVQSYTFEQLAHLTRSFLS